MCEIPDALVTHARLVADGTSRRRIAEWVSSGTLVRLRRGVYARREACRAVRAAASHGGALACVTAARHAGLWVLATGERVHVNLGGHGHAYAHDPCTCVEHWDEPRPPLGIRGIPQILLQIHRCAGIEDFFVALESALRQGRLSAGDLQTLRARGNSEVREAIALARADADSGLESLLRWRLRTRGLGIRSQVRILSVGVVDILIGDRLIVEADGAENHDGPSLRHKDLVRDGNAAAWGYITLRFDYAMIVHDWESVEQAIMAHVDRGDHLAARPGVHNRGA